jgi:excisionase family DNA binding protein
MERSFEPLIDNDQAADLLKVHPKVLQRMARRGEVPAHKIGKFWRFRGSELDAWLCSGLQSQRQPCCATEPTF